MQQLLHAWKWFAGWAYTILLFAFALFISVGMASAFGLGWETVLVLFCMVIMATWYWGPGTEQRWHVVPAAVFRLVGERFVLGVALPLVAVIVLSLVLGYQHSLRDYAVLIAVDSLVFLVMMAADYEDGRPLSPAGE